MHTCTCICTCTCRYQEKRDFAKQPRNFGKVLSIIIDGMDQQHSEIPYMGNQDKFPNPLKQSITAAKCHGYLQGNVLINNLSNNVVFAIFVSYYSP